jgi:hypothetical protein
VREISPFSLMWTIFHGLVLSLGYGLVSFSILWHFGGRSEAQLFFMAYTSQFKTIVSLGLIIGTALIIFRYQNVIAQVIEAAFTEAELAGTKYFVHKRRLESLRHTIEFSAEFFIIGFVIFSFCRFPLPRGAEHAMVIAACIEYALGVYVGRKLIWAGMMLHSLLKAKVTRNLFERRELDDINVYVNVASTLTIFFVYLHVMGYYGGPFKYDSTLGQSIKPFLILPAVIATPVLLIFNFYPRAVLRKLYSESIDIELEKLQLTLNNEGLSRSEKRSYLMQFDKMCRDELRYSLQLTLSDLPIGITILIMVLQPLLKR